jgi:hypothetical protein
VDKNVTARKLKSNAILYELPREFENISDDLMGLRPAGSG